MKLAIFSAALGCAFVASAWPASARAQSAPVLAPAAPAAVVAERSVLPNPGLLGVGIGTFVVSYGPAVAVGAISDHKGDHNLFIPVAGPWIDLGNRDCSGLTVQTAK